RTAALYELRGRGVRVELKDLARLPIGTILHWNMTHYVVFERVDGNEIVVVDPAFGRRAVPLEEASRSLTGVALLFEPGDQFKASASSEPALRRHLQRAAAHSADWGRVILTTVMLQIFGAGLPFINGRLIDRVVPRNDGQLLLVLAAGFGFV